MGAAERGAAGWSGPTQRSLESSPSGVVGQDLLDRTGEPVDEHARTQPGRRDEDHAAVGLPAGQTLRREVPEVPGVARDQGAPLLERDIEHGAIARAAERREVTHRDDVVAAVA